MNIVVHDSFWIMAFSGYMPSSNEVDGVRVCHTEWSKSEREKQIPYAKTYIWNLKKKKKKENGHEQRML